MAYAMDALDHFIREELPTVIHESLPDIAPLYKEIEQTSISVQRDKDIGRGWKVIHLFATGVAGLIQSSSPLGPAIEATGTSVRRLVAGDSTLTPFPTAVESPHTGSLKRELSLHMVTGNFSLPITWMQADTLSATQIQQVVRDVKAVGQLRAMIEASSFFHYTARDSTDAYDVHVLGKITAVAEDSASSDYVIFTLDEDYGRIANFRIGMSIDCVADSTGPVMGAVGDGTDIRNYDGNGYYVQLIINAVDYLSKTVQVVGIDTTSGGVQAFDGNDWGRTAQPVAAGDWLVLRGHTAVAQTRPMMSWGLEDWIKGSGTIMGGTAATSQGLCLDTWPQFKSQVVAVSGTLTDNIMNGYIGGYLDAYPGQSIDTIITTLGVSLKYLEQPQLLNNRMVYERTGKALDMNGGWEEINYSFNGRKMKWIMAPMCLGSRLYALKLGGGNIKRYVPPRIGGTDARVGAEVEFLAPIAGHTGVFMGATSSTGAPMSIVQAPFWQYKLVAPVDVRGIKLTGITEATLV